MADPAQVRQACVLAHYDLDPSTNLRVLRERPTPAVPGLLLCKGHHGNLRDILLELVPLVAELDQAMIPNSGRGGPNVTGDPEKALPFNEAAGAHVRRIRDVLASWAQQVVEGFGVHPPAFTHTGLIRFLERHHDWLCAQDWVSDYQQELRELRGRGKAVLAAVPRRKVDLGICGEEIACQVDSQALILCTGTLRATVSSADDELPSMVACTSCGKEHPSPAWRALGRRLRGSPDAWLTGPQLSEMFRVPFPTVRRWAAEDTWRRHPDGKRPTRFHVDDAGASFERRREVAS